MIKLLCTTNWDFIFYFSLLFFYLKSTCFVDEILMSFLFLLFQVRCHVNEWTLPKETYNSWKDSTFSSVFFFFQNLISWKRVSSGLEMNFQATRCHSGTSPLNKHTSHFRHVGDHKRVFLGWISFLFCFIGII